MAHDSQQNSSQLTVKQKSSPLDGAVDDELEAIIVTLKALPFKDETQKASLFENVHRLESYHVIDIFKLGVSPLQICVQQNSGFVGEVVKLFEICSSFCYTSDVLERVAFVYYSRVLKFCFPSEPKDRLSTSVVSMLLELVQIFQKGKLATFVRDKSEQESNSKVQVKGMKSFIAELLDIFEKRRATGDGYIAEIIAQTKRFASEDAKVFIIETPKDKKFRSNHIVSPVFLASWIKLLKFENVSNGLACSLAQMDAVSCRKVWLPLPSHVSEIPVHQSTVRSFVVNVLEDARITGSDICFPRNEERLGIFRIHVEHFCHHPVVTAALFKLLANMNINNEVLREVLDLILFDEKHTHQSFQEYGILRIFEIKGKAIDLASEVVTLLPDAVVIKLLKFWRESFSVDPDYQTLGCVLSIFVDSSTKNQNCQERAQNTLKFLGGLDLRFLRLITLWHPFLAWFVKEFPTSFHDQRRQEVLTLICNVSRASSLPFDQREAFVTGVQQFFDWVSEQAYTEEMNNEIIELLSCCSDGGSLVHNWKFATVAIKTLSLSKQLTFGSKKDLLCELFSWTKQFKKEEERSVFQKVIELTSSQNLECTDEILGEIVGFIRRFTNKNFPMKTIPCNVLHLISLVSTTTISGDRRVKILQKSKESGKGLLNSIRILNLIEWHPLKDEADEYFDLLYTAVVEMLKEETDVLDTFYEQCGRCPSQGQKVWILEVAKLISLGTFNEEIDCRCCLAVLDEAVGMSKVEMVQLFSQVRKCAEKISSGQNEIKSSPDPPIRVTPTFVSSLIHIVGSIKFSGEEKLLITKKVCDIFLTNSNASTEMSVDNVLHHLIPFSFSLNSSSPTNKEEMYLESNKIIAMLNDPKMVVQLSKIPASIDSSLCTVLSKMSSGSFCKARLADVYSFIGSQEDLDDGFFNHFLSVLEVIIQETSSVKDVMEILKELEGIIRAVPSDLIPLVMVSFGYLLEQQVNKQERERFLNEVVLKWDFSPNAFVLWHLKVPQLLWKMYTTTNCQAKRCEENDRVKQILKGANKEVESYCIAGHYSGRDDIRQISCCELEWLVFYSPLSNDEATLACNLCFRSFYPRIRCLFHSGLHVQLVDGRLTFVPQETISELGPHKDKIETPYTAAASTTIGPQALESNMPNLTRISIAQKMIELLKPLLGLRENLTEIAFLLWDTVFSQFISTCTSGCDSEFSSTASYLDEFVEVFLTILSEASSTDVILYWAKQNKHHIFQCSDVVLKACKKTSELEDMDKEVRLNFHTAVHNTMETVRRRTPDPSSCFFGLFAPRPVPCFRILKPQLDHLSNILGMGLPIEETLAVLDLFQVNFQAGVTVGEIVSSWTSQKERLKLIKTVKTLCKKGKMPALHNNAAQSEFVWQLAKAYDRLFVNSCEDVLAKIEELMEQFDREDLHGLDRLPGWRQKMLSEGFPSHQIDFWCTVFLATPPEDLSSRDVDAIVDLNAGSLQLVESVAKSIKSCIFPEHGFEVSHTEGIKETSAPGSPRMRETPTAKERIRLARLLVEFINVLKVGKPEENRKAAVIKKAVVDACNELCKARVEQKGSKELYKIRRQKLKDLLSEVFGKQRKPETGLTHQTGIEGSTAVSSFARQTSYHHENLPHVLSCNAVCEPLLLLLRRWLSGIVTKRNLAARTKEIVQLLFSAQFSDEGAVRLSELHDRIQAYILSLENNKALMAQLQAAGYNQKDEGSRDLWSSLSVECPGYLSNRESPGERRYRKKLVEVLRCVWNEWKDILYILGKPSIKVGETDVCTEDLFGLQASLEEIEVQVSAVKKTVSQFKSDELERRVTQLMRQEERYRARIKRLYASNKVN